MQAQFKDTEVVVPEDPENFRHRSNTDDLVHFWTVATDDLLQRLDTRPSGLGAIEARRRLRLYGPNRLRRAKRSDTLTLLLAQFKSPLILILLGAVILSFFLGEPVDASIIIAIILLSSALGFWQEKRASDAVKSLLTIVRIETRVVRDGLEKDVPAEEVVPGDICVLSAGDIIPGDAAILKSRDLFVQEAALTGESFPAEKEAGLLTLDTSLMKRTNALFMGTHVVSGEAHALIVFTGSSTEFGKVSERLRLKPPETEFEHGVRRLR